MSLEAMKEAMTCAVAMSLYIYNVDPYTRAKKIHDHFEGGCNLLSDLLELVDHRCWATQMPYETASVYMEHAMERYGKEALMRNQVEIGFGEI